MTAGHNFCYKPPRVATAMALLTRFHSSASHTVDALVPSTRPPGTVPRLDTATCIMTSSATLTQKSVGLWMVSRKGECAVPSDNVLRTVLHISSDGAEMGHRNYVATAFCSRGNQAPSWGVEPVGVLNSIHYSSLHQSHHIWWVV